MKKIFLLISLFFSSATLSFGQSSVEDKSEIDKINSPVEIIYKPEAAYPQSNNGTVCITGIVTLKVTFLDSGKVGKIAVVSGLPYGASENAVEAAKKIKFKPAQRNGRVISVSKIVTYNFTIY